MLPTSYLTYLVTGDANNVQVGSGTNIQDNSVVHVAKSNLSGKVFPTIIGDNVTVGKNRFTFWFLFSPLIYSTASLCSIVHYLLRPKSSIVKLLLIFSGVLLFISIHKYFVIGALILWLK